jgi:acyl-CoA thioesterase-1
VVAGETLAGDPVGGVIPAGAAPAACGAPAALMVLEEAQPRIAARIDRREPLTIVAIGSSSTQGAGASAPELSYPSRLEAALKERFPLVDIRVINRGIGGEDVPEEFARLERDVIAERPQLVIWQIGTNAVLRRDDLVADRMLIERGVAQLKASGSDVVLMDLQYAPRVIARPDHAEMLQLIEEVAERTAGVALFRRFEIMKHWQAPPEAPGQISRETDAATMIGRDGLHMTDRGYFCLATSLAEALASNWRSEEIADEEPLAARFAGMAGPHPVAAQPASAARKGHPAVGQARGRANLPGFGLGP